MVSVIRRIWKNRSDLLCHHCVMVHAIAWMGVLVRACLTPCPCVLYAVPSHERLPRAGARPRPYGGKLAPDTARPARAAPIPLGQSYWPEPRSRSSCPAALSPLGASDSRHPFCDRPPGGL